MISSLQRGEGTPQRGCRSSLISGLLLLLYHFLATVNAQEDGSETDIQIECTRPTGDYNIGARVGAIFIVLCTSSIAVFGPLLLSKLTTVKATSLVFTIIKQFGTGVIVATAFIHLLAEGEANFTNPCLGELEFGATSAAVAIAGIFLSFLVEYAGDRFVLQRMQSGVSADAPQPKKSPNSNENLQTEEQHVQSHVHTHLHGAQALVNDKISVMVMEAGIIFHSIIIGVTVVVTDNAEFTPLLIVIIFHQMFEGLALGTRIALLPPNCTSLFTRLLLALAFALITPIGMAIGIGVLHHFNENDKHTLVALGTLDSLSAGILVWVGMVEMWAADWLIGDMRTSGPLKTSIGLISLMAGIALMALLGKWA